MLHGVKHRADEVQCPLFFAVVLALQALLNGAAPDLGGKMGIVVGGEGRCVGGLHAEMCCS